VIRCEWPDCADYKVKIPHQHYERDGKIYCRRHVNIIDHREVEEEDDNTSLAEDIKEVLECCKA
jgi:hypothetical protein